MSPIGGGVTRQGEQFGRLSEDGAQFAGWLIPQFSNGDFVVPHSVLRCRRPPIATFWRRGHGRARTQTQIIDRRTRALERVDARELAALERDLQRQAHTRGRGEDGAMPSLTGTAKTEHHNKGRPPDLLQAFERATKERRTEPPYLTAAFDKAAREQAESQRGKGLGKASFDRAQSPEFSPHQQRDGRSRDGE
jgi:hypothetical protein